MHRGVTDSVLGPWISRAGGRHRADHASQGIPVVGAGVGPGGVAEGGRAARVRAFITPSARVTAGSRSWASASRTKTATGASRSPAQARASAGRVGPDACAGPPRARPAVDARFDEGAEVLALQSPRPALVAAFERARRGEAGGRRNSQRILPGHARWRCRRSAPPSVGVWRMTRRRRGNGKMRMDPEYEASALVMHLRSSVPDPREPRIKRRPCEPLVRARPAGGQDLRIGHAQTDQPQLGAVAAHGCSSIGWRRT